MLVLTEGSKIHAIAGLSRPALDLGGQVLQGPAAKTSEFSLMQRSGQPDVSPRTMLLTGQTEESMIPLLATCIMSSDLCYVTCNSLQRHTTRQGSGWENPGLWCINYNLSSESFISYFPSPMKASFHLMLQKGTYQTKNSGEKQSVSNLLSVSGIE